MLCNTCRRSLLHRLRASHTNHHSHPTRSIATVPVTSNAAPTQPPDPILHSQTPPALSSSKPGSLQPLSTPHFPPATSSQAASPKAIKPTPKAKELRGSLPGGAELRGIGYLKTKPTILAKEDDEYPPWLWTLLDKSSTGENKVDVSAMTKKQRHKYDRKQERLMRNVAAAVPLHEQSKDLTGPGDDAVTSLERRQEITKSARVARRKGIRESNFLRGV